MGRDRIRYLVFTYGRWRWRPTNAMRARGFQQIILSEGIVVNGRNYPSAEDEAMALRLNADWDRIRWGQPELAVEQQRVSARQCRRSIPPLYGRPGKRARAQGYRLDQRAP
jgi:hypothetical protein